MLLNSERLTLRPVEDLDAETLLGIFRDAAVRRYLLDDMLVTPEWVEAEIKGSVARFNAGQAGLWLLRLTTTDQVAGFAGFREFLEPPRLQLLYGLLPAFWGQGLALEAAGEVCRYASSSLGFERIEAAADVPNTRSIKVLERLGMSLIETQDSGTGSTAVYELWADSRDL